MSELEEKLGAILSNQDAMGQIMALAKSLGGGDAADAPPPAAPDAEPSASSAPEPPGSFAADLGGLDPRLLSMAAKLAGAYSSGGGDDRRVALLTALGPFVKEERRAKLGKAIQIARLTRVVRIALDSFRTKEENHV